MARLFTVEARFYLTIEAEDAYSARQEAFDIIDEGEDPRDFTSRGVEIGPAYYEGEN